MTSLKPRPKVAAAGIAGALTTLVLWVLALYGLSVPPEVAAAIAAVLSFAAGWLKSE